MKEINRNTRNTNRINRRTVLHVLGGAGVTGLAGCLGSGDEGGHMGESGAEFTFLDETYTRSGSWVECNDYSSGGGAESEPFVMAAIDLDGPDLSVRIYDDSVEVSLSFESEEYEAEVSPDDVSFDVESDENYVAGTVHLEPDGGDVEFNISC